MSHLPAKPEYTLPAAASMRYDARHRPAPMSEHAHAHYPPRDAYPPRSPPPPPSLPPAARLPRHPPPPDLYAVPPGAYMPRDYPPRYDRREEERRREYWEHERRERDREYPPTPAYRDRFRDERGWPRWEDSRDSHGSRREPDDRAWTRREDGDRRRDRDRRRPYEGDRTFHPRPSASPPRNYASRRPEPSRRSPPPRRYSRSRSRSPRRSTSPSKPRLGSHSVASPRRAPRDDDRYPLGRRGGPGPPGPARSRSHSRSIPRSPRRRQHSRSRSPLPAKRRRESSDSSYRRRVRSRTHSRAPSNPPVPRDGEPKAQIDRMPEKVETGQQKEQAVESQPEHAVAASDVPLPAPSSQIELAPVDSQPTAERTGTQPASSLTIQVQPPTSSAPSSAPSSALTYMITSPVVPTPINTVQEPPSLARLQPVAVRNLPGSSSAAASPQMRSPNISLQPNKLGPNSRSATPPEAASAALPPPAAGLFTEEQIREFEIPPCDTWYHTRNDVHEFLRHIDSKIIPRWERRAHLESERFNLYLDAHSALQEFEAGLLDVRMVEKRRKIAAAQLELAKEGLLGIDYDKSAAAATTASIVGEELPL